MTPRARLPLAGTGTRARRAEARYWRRLRLQPSSGRRSGPATSASWPAIRQRRRQAPDEGVLHLSDGNEGYHLQRVSGQESIYHRCWVAAMGGVGSSATAMPFRNGGTGARVISVAYLG